MDLHPIIVHFPIALLFVWSLIEVIRPGRWFKTIQWESVQKVLLFVGFVGALIALSTGEDAEKLAGHSQLVELHSNIATITTWIYAVFIVDEVLKFKFVSDLIGRYTNWYSKILANIPLRIILAILAFIGLFLTGLFGGAIVYGTSADPLAEFFLTLFGVK